MLLPESDSDIITIISANEPGAMFMTQYYNELGTGYEMYCTNTGDGYVSIEIYQVIMGVEPDYPSVSLLLPLSAAITFVTTIYDAVFF